MTNGAQILAFRRTHAPVWRDAWTKRHAYARHSDGMIARRSLCMTADREDVCSTELPRCARCERLANR